MNSRILIVSLKRDLAIRIARNFELSKDQVTFFSPQDSPCKIRGSQPTMVIIDESIYQDKHSKEIIGEVKAMFKCRCPIYLIDEM